MILLDTHVLLWCLTDDKKLKPSIHKLIINPENQIFVSSVSAWEMVIKKSLGKLACPSNIEEAALSCNFEWLPITVSDALKVSDLPQAHHDPFDRLLIAQALNRGLTLLTADKKLEEYPVKLILN